MELNMNYTADTLRLCKCGRTFVPYRSFQHYCCDSHRIKYSAGAASRYVKKIIKVKQCKECGKDFKTNDSKKHYCSVECYKEFQHKLHKPKELRVCLICGAEFESAHWSKRYCTTECRMKARSL